MDVSYTHNTMNYVLMNITLNKNHHFKRVKGVRQFLIRKRFCCLIANFNTFAAACNSLQRRAGRVSVCEAMHHRVDSRRALRLYWLTVLGQQR